MSVEFKDLKLNINKDIEIVEWEGQKIEVKQYLPIQDKLNLVATIVNDSVDENNYYNPAKIYVYTILETLMYYTNLKLSDEDKEKVEETFDLLASSGLSTKIFEQINPYEYKQICGWVESLIDSIYKYKNSALGILESIQENYDEADMDVDELKAKLESTPDELKLLKDVMDKLG